jgi:hypothetical protein
MAEKRVQSICIMFGAAPLRRRANAHVLLLAS